jgi:cleavage and polyadenylation specificity factor subunit 1
MQCYTELIPPSAVTHAISLPFLDSKAQNLVVAKTCLLQVFRPKTLENDESEGVPKSKLVLVGEYPLSGTVTSLASIKALNTKSGGDALIVSFKDAKLSLIEWDPENYRISTISIHYYEGENVIHEPFGPGLGESETILTVDPSSRCAALRFGSRHLAILPFRQLGDDLMEGGEDGFDAEMDIAPPSATLKRTQAGLNEVAASEAKQTPYTASFVLPLTALDPSLTHPVDLAFLHEYREPTFGILSAPVQTSTSLLGERKDVLSYTVFTLDLEQRASTNLISAPNLPSDLWKVVPLPLPVGGALLVGTNELVHVDQSGKTIAVAVNEFAKESSNLNMIDQSDLKLKLEGCNVGALDTETGDLLLLLNDGSMAVTTFRLLGRNVGGLKVAKVAPNDGGTSMEVAASCVTSVTSRTVFIGSEEGDSALISWSKPMTLPSRKRSYAQMLGSDTAVDEDEDADDLDEDDLYATTSEANKRRASSIGYDGTNGVAAYKFEVQDRLVSLGPINSVCMGRSSSTSKGHLEMLAAVGRDCGSRLATLSRDIVPDVTQTGPFAGALNAWSITAKQPAEEGEAEPQFDNMFFCYDGETTRVFDVTTDYSGDNTTRTTAKYAERTGTEFEHDGETMEVSTIAQGTRIVQCRRTEIRTYDPLTLGLIQIIPMMDDETDAELKIVHISISDPYIVAIRDDSSILVLQLNDGDVEPLDVEGAARETKWISGCLYRGEMCQGQTIICLLGEDGGLHLFDLPNLELVHHITTLPSLPAVLSTEAQQRRVGAKETLTEVLLTDIGTTEVQQTHLIVRTAMDDLILYEPLSDSSSWTTALRFRKVPFNYIPKFDEMSTEISGGRPTALQRLCIGKYFAVHIPGPSPSFIFKEATSLAKAVGLRARNVSAIVPLDRQGHGLCLGVLSEGTLQECVLPTQLEFSSGWCVTKMSLGDPAQDVRRITFHEERQMYVVATCKDVDFYFPSEDARHSEQDGKPYLSFKDCITSIYVYFLFSRGATSIVDARLKSLILDNCPADR